MISFPNAKINLGLNIVAKRNDGFHDIETVFYPIPLCDILEIIKSPNGELRFKNTGIEIPGSTVDNLCMKAYNLLNEKFNLPPVHIHLHKIIPDGAGLGGGSSDAAFTLKLLNDLFTLNLSEEQLMDFARKLGSDCAFFIQNKPVYAKGKGDVFEEIDISLQGKMIIVVKPRVKISTQSAYKNIIPSQNQDLSLTSYHLSRTIFHLPIKQWKNKIANDFEKNIFVEFPEIKTIKEELYSMGSIYVSMSGSGSAVYGIFDHLPETEGKFADCFCWKGELLSTR